MKTHKKCPFKVTIHADEQDHMKINEPWLFKRFILNIREKSGLN